MTTLERTGTFIATDEDGNKYTIVVYQEYEWRDGVKYPLGIELETADGEDMNWLGKGRYEILRVIDTPKLTSDDPNAP